MGESSGRKWDIEPTLDRLVMFRSDLVEHEVCRPARLVRERGVIPVAKGCLFVRPQFFSPHHPCGVLFRARCFTRDH